MRKRPTQPPKKSEVTLARSSAAEYLTFIAATGGGNTSVEMRYEDENLWLTQKMMATLYDVSVPTISQHLKRIYADNELSREATVKQYLMVQGVSGNRPSARRKRVREIPHRAGSTVRERFRPAAQTD